MSAIDRSDPNQYVRIMAFLGLLLAGAVVSGLIVPTIDLNQWSNHSGLPGPGSDPLEVARLKSMGFYVSDGVSFVSIGPDNQRSIHGRSLRLRAPDFLGGTRDGVALVRETPLLADLQQLEGVRTLYLGGVDLLPEDLAGMQWWPTLIYLHINDKQNDDALLDLLAKHHTLEILRFDGTEISETKFAKLSQMKSLNSLSVWQDGISGQFLQHFRENRSLRHLELQGRGLEAENLRFLLDTQVTHLKVSGKPSEILEHLLNNPVLQKVTISAREELDEEDRRLIQDFNSEVRGREASVRGPCSKCCNRQEDEEESEYLPEDEPAEPLEAT